MTTVSDRVTLLHDDGHYRLCRELRDEGVVLVKSASRDAARAASEAALRREAELLATLPGAERLRPRAASGADGMPQLLFDDPGGGLLSMQAGPWTIERVLCFGLQIAEALTALHARGLVHQALQPAAIWCTPDGTQHWLIDAAEVRPPTQPGAASVPMSAARLAYAAPEQTGRTAQGSDARSDLYALGLLLYERLTGTPAVRSDDVLELVHWQIAGAPPPWPASVPAALAAVVSKLLAKAPEARYRSAGGLAHDLERCRDEFAAHGAIAAFAAGQEDREAQPDLPARLYGREADLQRLEQAFEEVCREGEGARPMLVLVSGYAGIGKTALIQQLYRPIVRRQGHFISGKFDQLAQATPYSAPIQAVRELMRQLLTEREDSLARWRERLATALAGDGGVLAEVMPEIEIVLGPQAPPVALAGVEAANRFQRVVHDFVAALAAPAHPLVLFLDDLQWADAATLALLGPLLSSRDIRGLLIVGACRDQEVDAAHALTRTLHALDAAGAALQRLSLEPLRLPELTRLVQDCLHGTAADAEPLARLVIAKTGGNPFFVQQFLKQLTRDGRFRYDALQARWVYRLDELLAAPLADDVIDLMTHGIRRLAPRSQYTLTLAACIGSRFDAATLATVSEQAPAAARADLAPALDEGLLLALGAADEGRYEFLHDRVQQAAYALIPEARRRRVHLQVGRLLRDEPGVADDARLFDVLHHLNLGRALIGEAGERRQTARLNLAAGRRAKSSTAHEAALALLHAGLDLLSSLEPRGGDEALAFELQCEAAESEYLCGRFDEAERHFAALIERTATIEERARVARLRGVLYENQSRYAEALACARESLALLGVPLPEATEAKEAALREALLAIDARLAGRDIEALIELPPLADARVRVAMSTLTDIWSSAYIVGDPTLARLISATMVQLSLAHGHGEDSAYGYVTHAITVGPLQGRYRDGHAYGRLALAVEQRHGSGRRRAKIYQQYHAHVSLWSEPWPRCLAYAREASRSGLASGDFLYGAYGAGTELWTAIPATQDLPRFLRDYEPTVALLDKLKSAGFADSVKLILNWARALQGRTAHPLSLSDASLNEDGYRERHRDNPFFTTIHGVLRLHLACLFATPALALDAARQAGLTVHRLPGTVWPVLHAYWQALAIGAAAEDDRQCRDAAAHVREVQRQFETLAEYCPYNYRAQALVLAAEAARLEGRTGEALAALEAAIEYAAAHELWQEQSLACERAGRLRLALGQAVAARLLLAEALAACLRWGATAKATALLHEFPALAPGESSHTPKSRPTDAAAEDGNARQATAVAGGDDLDLHSVLRAAQAIAVETEPARLLARLMRIALQSAGAERGVLVLDGEDGESGSRAHAWDPPGDADEMPTGVPLDAASDLPLGLLRYVQRTGDSVVLDDAAADERHGDDPYIAGRRPRSVMCLPLRLLGRPLGVLYLENGSAPGVFTAGRLRVLQVLASEAASALEHARLIDGLKREIGERRHAQAELGRALAEVQRLKDDLEAENRSLRRDLMANVSHDLRTPLVSMHGYLELMLRKGDALAEQERRQYLEIALRQSERLARLIDELFELAKLDFKGLQLEREPFQFIELASDVLQKFKLAADAREIGLRLDAPALLPFAHGDVSLIERVLDNLIANALRHTPAGGTITLRLSAQTKTDTYMRTESDSDSDSDSGAIVAEVADTGSGIAEADLPHVFDRYYRSRSQSDGAGLGLAIVRRIVELHGGSVSVRNVEGGGACFRFALSRQHLFTSHIPPGPA